MDHDDLPALPPHGAGIDPHVRDALPEIQEQIAEDAARADLEAALSALPHADVTGSVLTGWPATRDPAARGRLRRRAAGDRDRGAPRAPAPPPRQRLGSARRRRAVPGRRRAARTPRCASRGPSWSATTAPSTAGAPSATRRRWPRGSSATSCACTSRTATRSRSSPAPRASGGRAWSWPGPEAAGRCAAQLFGSVSTGLVRAAGRPVMLVSPHATAPA